MAPSRLTIFAAILGTAVQLACSRFLMESTDPECGGDACLSEWKQCGGSGFNISACCEPGTQCTVKDAFYAQCLTIEEADERIFLEGWNGYNMTCEEMPDDIGRMVNMTDEEMPAELANAEAGYESVETSTPGTYGLHTMSVAYGQASSLGAYAQSMSVSSGAYGMPSSVGMYGQGLSMGAYGSVTKPAGMYSDSTILEAGSYGDLATANSYGSLAGYSSYGGLAAATSYGDLAVGLGSYGPFSYFSRSYGDLAPESGAYGSASLSTASYGSLAAASYGSVSAASYGSLAAASYGSVSASSYGSVAASSYGSAAVMSYGDSSVLPEAGYATGATVDGSYGAISATAAYGMNVALSYGQSDRVPTIMGDGCDVCAPEYGHCAVVGSVVSCCAAGLECVQKNAHYGQCLAPERRDENVWNHGWEGSALPCGDMML